MPTIASMLKIVSPLREINRVFRDYDDVIEASSSAWNRLTAEQGRIASIATRTWTAIGQGP
jgi:hypothetical protein